MADLAALRQQIADAINAGLPDPIAMPYIPDQIQPPVAIVEPDYIDWDEGGMARGAEHWHFLVRVLLSLAGGNVAAQVARDEYLGGPARDIKDAIQAAMPNSSVSSARKFDAWEYAGSQYLGVEFAVLVIA